MELVCGEKPQEEPSPKPRSQAGSRGLKWITQIHLQSSRKSTDSWHFQSYKKKKKSETSHKFIEVSNKKGLIWFLLCPLSWVTPAEISIDWCFTSVQDVVTTLWSGWSDSSEPSSSPHLYICHISGYQVHLKQRQCCDTRSYSDCPMCSPEMQHGVGKSKRG